MKILSINTSTPIELIHEGKTVRTSIFKHPVKGPVYVSKFNVEGDEQADRDNHGGEFKAVYAYSYDHYSYWSKILGRNDLEYGHFGETLTVSGLDESEVCIGDQLQVGEVKFAVTQPRVPCSKLGIRFEDNEMPKKFLQSALTGCYFRVLKEGYIQVGDDIAMISHKNSRISIKDLFKAVYLDKGEVVVEILQKSLQMNDLSPSWRKQIKKRLAK
jgi:MOSC domain-containing protein YiiM